MSICRKLRFRLPNGASPEPEIPNETTIKEAKKWTIV